ncbi:uncharacterized protein [Chironomus tepperi]|uniref:uncharacterized protein n=1 Tax=Chironomus tepperi TaxID=113505 RepID=UPI00391F1F9E
MDPLNIRKTSIEHLEYRFGSSSSSQTSGDFCRICHETDAISPLLTPCMCAGSLRYVHQQCLQQWLTASEMNSCELCKFPFIMQSKIKPFNEWRSLDMSGVERRRLFCAVLFHLAAALCVIWSLCVLIERSAEEVRLGKLGWPFWTKLVVVTVGLTGGIVFMYIQCKQYLNLCSRWRARNRILLIQNAPEKPVLHPSHSPATIQNSHQSSVEPNASSMLRRNNSSIMVIAAPINVIENNEQQQYQYNSAHPSHRQQSQIVANIENNSLCYELDDDISYSQISFKHHLRHDEGASSRGSLHNVYDNTSVSTTNTSATTKNLAIGGDNDSNFHRIIPGLEEVKEHDDDDRRMKIRYNDKIGTSIFVENDDILNDKNYPKITHRHSTLLLPTSINSVGNDEDLFRDERHQKKRRRYSDTKLLNSCEFENEFLIDNKNKQKCQHVFGSPTMTTKTKGMDEPNEANMNDLIFEKSDDFDPMELNIQNILEIDLRSNRKASDGQAATNSSSDNSRSLPNLDGV